MAEGGDDSDKTEDPTQRKLDQAREQGQLVNSREVGHLFALAAIAFGLLVVAPWSAARLSSAMRNLLGNAGYPNDDAGALGWLLLGVFSEAAISLAPLMALGFVAALAAPILQGAVTFTTETLMPKGNRISPLAGLKRIFSLHNIVELVKGILKIAAVSTVGWMILWPQRDLIPRLGEIAAAPTLALMSDLAIRLLAAIGALLFILAAIDWVWQRHHHIEQLRMSRDEVRREHKESDGDPIVKQRLRALRMERSRRRMMAEVPKATVVVTNPTHFSVALRYDEGTAAPVVVAKGTELLAFKIREVAKEHRVPVIESPPLARALHAQVEVGQAVPPAHYQAVAEIIALVMRLPGTGRRPT